ncbi:EAL domain-containing protein [Actinoplanes sp. Pm04-4]|uniref:EAL domain-containing protein n=1 Tax=Paractinoplanes pyxinae TaxID=2997416 RepID=A0ABT4ATH9_9ACTN|nr:EAL domain-containing protein [Actinoplanes pyxinae]MCY1136710.1 EAL domain-containing protein [Actinoplanes pyxinae]
MPETPGRPSLFADRAFQAVTALLIIDVAAFVAQEHTGRLWPAPLNWLLMIAVIVPTLVLCRRVETDPGSAPVVRRYWLTVRIGASLFVVVAALRFLSELGAGGWLVPVSVVLHLAGGIVLTWPLVGLPFSARSRARKLGVGLDLGTLCSAAGLLIWHFAASEQFAGGQVTPARVAAAVVIMGAGVNGVYLAAKVVLAGVDSFARRGLYWIGASALIGGLGSAVAFLHRQQPEGNLLVLVLPLAAYAAAVGARMQVVDTAAGERRPRKVRGYSLMPYVGIAAVNAMVVYHNVRHTADGLLIDAVAVTLTMLVVIRQLITFRHNDTLQERLSYEAGHDMLTGLANRSLFGDRVAGALAGAGPDQPLSIVLVDLDDFKIVNDTLGHATGDALLVHVAERMRASVRPDDMVARLGGDEFAILFSGVAGPDVDLALTRIANALLEPVLIDGEPMTVRASFGIVDGRGGDDAGDLLRRADIAMYEAKGRGEGGYERYRPGMEARGAERSRQVAALRTALLEEQLVVFFQPVVTLPGGRITGAEALVRWQHPEKGLLGPGAFIDAAEQSGLIVPLGTWVLRAATREAATWPGELTVSVNVSARQLRQTGFPAVVASALRDSGLPAHRLTVEITESVAVGGGATSENLQALRDLGVRLSLDDFGTGASTLSLLATCPVDQIKLDRSFVPDGGSEAIADAVLQMARAFGLQAVAEGIETAEQAERLTELGYERAQGFHFARPMPAADLRSAVALGEAGGRELEQPLVGHQGR